MSRVEKLYTRIRATSIADKRRNTIASMFIWYMYIAGKYGCGCVVVEQKYVVYSIVRVQLYKDNIVHKRRHPYCRSNDVAAGF